MRILWTALFSVIFLGSTITPGWCPQPAEATASGRTNSRTGAANASDDRPRPQLYRSYNEILTRSRWRNLPDRRELAVGHAPPKPSSRQPTKPASMSQATWHRIQAGRSVQPPPSNSAMDRLQGMQ
jgi:hypothetical protein